MSDLRPCPFCGKEAERSVESADELFCSLCIDTDATVFEHLWNNAYCWKQLDASQSLVRELQREIEERKSEFTQTNAGLLKFIDEQAETIRVLREAAWELCTHPAFTPGTLAYELLPSGIYPRVEAVKEALLATAKEKGDGL